MDRMIGNTTVRAKEWKKQGQHRIYFTIPGERGGACWDVNAQQWVHRHMDFGARFKAQIAEAFGLGK